MLHEEIWVWVLLLGVVGKLLVALLVFVVDDVYFYDDDEDLRLS